MVLSNRAAALVIIGGLLSSLAGCGEVEATQTPSFEASPEAFRFPRLSVGQEAVRPVTITNRGSGTLIVIDIRLDDRSSNSEFALFGLDDQGGLVPAPTRLELAQEESATLAVQYLPTDESPDAGDVLLQTNDPTALEVALPVETASAAGEISVNPRTVDFGQIEVGETGTVDLTITNLGVFDLVITRLEVSGRDGFGVVYEGAEVGGVLAQPITIGQGASVVLGAAYTPASLGVAEGELLIESNAVNGQITTVNMYANGAVPCLDVVPESVDFGAGLLVDSRDEETLNRRLVSLESCGTTPLRIDRIEFEDPGDAFGALDLPMVEPDAPLFELPAATPGQPNPSSMLNVGFWPQQLQVYGGRMLVYSNATPADEPTAVDLFGRGVDNACPIPVATREVYDVQPLDIITLDGSPSTDPDGEVRQWRWTVVDRPDGSVTVPVESFDDPRRPADGGPDDDTGTPQAQFFVDLAGEYIIELQAVDALGTPSCDPPAARVIVNAVPEKDLHVQLVWNTPDDPDETDTFGTDVDLHLRHERGGLGWGSDAGEWDCYFRNKQPDWGLVGEVVDNPTLDIDDTNGAGPENINLAEPEVGVSYDIGAIYFRSESTFGDPEADRRLQHPSYVTVRVYTRGDLLFELVGQELDEVRELWHVGRVTWCEGAGCPQVDIVDQVLPEAEYALP